MKVVEGHEFAHVKYMKPYVSHNGGESILNHIIK
jgi:hypothetical protein